MLVLVLVIFFLSPRDPELIFNSASGVSLSFSPFKLSLKVRYLFCSVHARARVADVVICSLKENFLLENPNYVTLNVKLFTGAVYYNDTSIGEWDFKPSTIGLRDDKVLFFISLLYPPPAC